MFHIYSVLVSHLPAMIDLFFFQKKEKEFDLCGKKVVEIDRVKKKQYYTDKQKIEEKK